MLNQSLYEIFATKNLSDLIIVGYTDTVRGFKYFNASMGSIFLKFEENIIRVESYQQYTKVRLTITDEAAYSEASVRAEEDELMIFPALNLYTQYETDGLRHLESISLFYDEDCDIESGIYRAVGFQLAKNAGYLFFDPTSLSGIVIGSSNQEKHWFENWKFWQNNNKTHFGDITRKILHFDRQKTANKTLQYYMGLPYPILLTPPEQEGDGWYAEIPLLDGCGTSGETQEEVLVGIEEAKRLWFETMLEANQTIPEPERVR